MRDQTRKDEKKKKKKRDLWRGGKMKDDVA